MAHDAQPIFKEYFQIGAVERWGRRYAFVLPEKMIVDCGETIAPVRPWRAFMPILRLSGVGNMRQEAMDAFAEAFDWTYQFVMAAPEKYLSRNDRQQRDVLYAIIQKPYPMPFVWENMARNGWAKYIDAEGLEHRYEL